MLTGDDLLVEAPVRIEWKGRAARALFAVLALQPGEPISRDRLAGLLWSESDQQSARASLRMALLALRRTIDPVDPDLIRATNESIMLDLERGSVDWALFESLCAQPDPDSRLKALELYRGDLLAPLPAPYEAVSEFLRDERERLRGIAIETGVALIAAFEDKAEPDRVRSITRKILTIEPANEPAHRALMRAHAAAGDRSAALRQYQQCCEALDEHYDLGPSAETLALRAEIVETEAGGAPEPAGRTGASGRTEAVSSGQPPAPRLRSRWRGVLLAALALVTLVLVGREFWPCGLTSDCPPDPPLAVVVLSPLKFTETDRRVADIAGDLTTRFEKTLNRIPGASVFAPTSPGKFPAILKDSYLVTASIERDGEVLRFYVDLFDRGGREVLLSDRFDVDIDTLALIDGKLEARLIPALRSKIEGDRPSD
jgi:DNA-binding SARP family transcriptional activator/TolB-like protein